MKFIILLILLFIKKSTQYLVEPISRDIFEDGLIKMSLQVSYYNFFDPHGIGYCDKYGVPVCDPEILIIMCALDPKDPRDKGDKFKDFIGGLFRRCNAVKNKFLIRTECLQYAYHRKNKNREWIEWNEVVAYKNETIYAHDFYIAGLLLDHDYFGMCQSFVSKDALFRKKDKDVWYDTEFFQGNRAYLIIPYTSKMKYSYRYQCSEYYHDEHCWNKIDPIPDRQLVDGREITCVKPWSEVEYINTLRFYRDMVVSTFNCDILNVCEMKEAYCPVKLPYCFMQGNGTAYCVNLQPKYISQSQETKNVTSRVLLYSERLDCNYEITGSLPDGFVSSQWRPEGDLMNLASIDGKSLFITAYIDPERPLLIDCEFTFKTSKSSLLFPNTFTLAGLPTRAVLYNTTYDGYTGAYLGQTIDCRTDAWPRINITASMKLISKNFILKGNVYVTTEMPIMIPDNAIIGVFEVECDVVSYFDRLRKENKFRRLFEMTLKSFVYFKWRTPYKNVYFINEQPQCIFASYIPAYTWLRQTDGDHFLEFGNFSEILLENILGGFFSVQCYLEFENNPLVYRRMLSFSVNRMPTLACYQIYARIRGGILQCNHDGYPPDEGTVDIAITDSVDGQMIANGGSSEFPYVRIPYVVIHKKIDMLCKINYHFNKTYELFEKWDRIDLLDDSHDKRRYTAEYKECAIHGLIPEFDDIEIEDDFFNFYKPISQLVPNPSVWMFVSVCLPTALLFMFALVVLRTLLFVQIFGDSKALLMYSSLANFRKGICRRNLLDKLTFLAECEVRKDMKVLMELFDFKINLDGSVYDPYSKPDSKTIKSLKSIRSIVSMKSITRLPSKLKSKFSSSEDSSRKSIVSNKMSKSSMSSSQESISF